MPDELREAAVDLAADCGVYAVAPLTQIPAETSHTLPAGQSPSAHETVSESRHAPTTSTNAAASAHATLEERDHSACMVGDDF